MSLFQKPAADTDASRPLDIPPDKVLEMDEEEWYAKVYRGADAPQLTIRAVLMGSGLGFLLAFTNLYVGLKTGWGLGVAITAALLAYALWSGLQKAGLAKSPMSILETNCMQSTASAAGYATVGTVVSAIAALLMLSATEANPKGTHLPWMVLGAWTLCQAALGTVLAIPMKRNMINREKLRFPSGTAAATTLYSLYSEGASAMKKAKLLVWTAIGSAVVPLLIDLHMAKDEKGNGATLLPTDSPMFDWLPARGTHIGADGAAVANKPSDWTIVMDHNPVMIAAGALVGRRVTLSMLLAGLALAYIVGPLGAEAAWLNPITGKEVLATSVPGRAWKEIGLWLGVPIMVSSGLLSFALQWKTIVRAFKGATGGSAGSTAHEKLVAETEVPFQWFLIGTLVSGAGCVAIAAISFGVPWHYGVLAVLMTFVLALVACRATGESDITPVGAMGKIMQLTYGVLIPQSTTANLMTASITASASGAAADLLNDLKSGYLLGANPRRQFIAQASGIVAGTIATVVGFYLLVPDATALTGIDGKPPAFPAPAAQTWKAVAELFKYGFGNMHPMHQQAIAVGLAIGAALLVCDTLAPKNVKPWLPSATGVGLGLILPFQFPLSMFIGAVIAHLWTKRSAKSAEDYLVPASAGIIAGVSIMGVLVAFVNNIGLG